MDYETIKRLARDSGVRVTDLCALAPGNDPFYTGRPSEVKAARWFADLWHQFGYTRGVHLRRVHYRIVSQDPPVSMPDGTPYENTDRCWVYLCNAGKWARYLDMVDPAAFVDRRNPEAVVNASFLGDPTPGYDTNTAYDFDIYLPDFKYSDEQKADQYSSGADTYVDDTQSALLEMHRQVGVAKPAKDGLMHRGLMIRHLVMPNNTAGTQGVIQWIAKLLPRDTYLNLMSQYRPMYKAYDYPKISRRITRKEYKEVLRRAKAVGLTNVHTQIYP